jgi:hypothetical protein
VATVSSSWLQLGRSGPCRRRRTPTARCSVASTTPTGPRGVLTGRSYTFCKIGLAESLANAILGFTPLGLAWMIASLGARRLD